MTHVIGLVGEICAGKGTFSKLLSEKLGPRIPIIRFSDPLFETLGLWGKEASRQNLQLLSESLDRAFPGILAEITYRRARNTMEDFVVVDGIRWPADYSLLCECEQKTLLYITAPVEIRYDRRLTQNEKVGDKNLTLEEFKKSHLRKTEIHIPEIGNRADVKIINDGTLEDLEKEAHKIAMLLKTKLQKT